MKLTFREVSKNDLPILIKMMADDKLASKQEDISKSINQSYLSAFSKIKADPNNDLIVAVSDDEIIGKMQLTYIRYLGHMGAQTCIIAGVRVDKQYRGQGLGSEIVKWGIERAKSKGCNSIKLTSNKQRTDAIRFYKKLGFDATHEGFRLMLN